MKGKEDEIGGERKRREGGREDGRGREGEIEVICVGMRVHSVCN